MARFKSPICEPGYRKGVPNKHKGDRFPAETYTREEIIAMREQCNCGPSGLRDRALLTFIYRTGARIAEACRLRVHDVDFERRTVHLRGTKTRTADRTVGIDEMTLNHLRDWLDIRHREIGQPATMGYVFCCISRNERGNMVKPTQFRQKMKLLARKAGISKRAHPHGCRHSFATDLYDEGADMRLISKALGHANSVTTTRYVDHVKASAVSDYMAARK